MKTSFIRRLVGGLKKSPERGMTLIEIMVVITLIGIVTTMFVVNVMGRMKKAKIKTAATQMQSIAQQVEAYEIDNGDIPSAEDGLQVLVDEEYLKKLPKDPWKHPYRYIVPGSDGSSFEIVSDGPDKKEGTDDDISTAEKE